MFAGGEIGFGLEQAELKQGDVSILAEVRYLGALLCQALELFGTLSERLQRELVILCIPSDPAQIVEDRGQPCADIDRFEETRPSAG